MAKYEPFNFPIFSTDAEELRLGYFKIAMPRYSYWNARFALLYIVM